VRKQGNPQLLQPGDVFHLGACTASLTAVLAAKFVDEGYFSWNTTLPEVYGSGAVHAMHQNTTIGMLSSSTAGIYPAGSASAFGAWWDKFRDESADSVISRASFTNEVLAGPPVTMPGTSYNFSTPGYMALASILERKTNRTWEDLASELFSSAQMDGCGFGVQPESSRSAVDNPWPHAASSSGPVPQIPDALHGDIPPALWPAVGIHCTISSFARFLQIQLDGYYGRPTPILSRSAFDVLQSPWPGLARDRTYGGWAYDATSVNGTQLYISGTNTMNYAWAWLLVEQDEAFLSFTNVGGKSGRSASAAALYSFAGYSDLPHDT
jgi:CubicO group peptidase (beta-lactamase class C family)